MENELYNTQNIKKRLLRTWIMDGLNELFLGVLFAFIGGSMFVIALFEGQTIGIILGITYPLIIIGIVIGANIVIKKLKNKYIYPNTGYIMFKRYPIKKHLRRILVICLGVSIPFILLSLYNLRQIQILLTGIILLSMFSIVFYQTKYVRFLFFGMISFVSAIIIYFTLPFRFNTFAYAYLFASPFLLLSGTINFISYLKNNSNNNSIKEERNE